MVGFRTSGVEVSGFCYQRTSNTL